ncbi:MAG TPA: EAL domain-containing protein [Lysobacter sp.]|nr:EAL domain-containing protein [Lysobacter sp.]
MNGKAAEGIDAATRAAEALAELDAALLGPNLAEPQRALLEQARAALVASRSALEHEQARYRTLLDAVPDPVSVLSWDGIVLDLNKAGMKAYKRPREDIIGKPIELLNPDLPKDHLVPVWETLRRGETYVIEVTNMRADGSRFPVEVHSALLRRDDEDCIVAVARDLSARAEAELRYRELMETVDKGIILRDAGGDIVHANAAAMRILELDSRRGLEETLRNDVWLTLDEDGREVPEELRPATYVQRTGRRVDSTVLGFYNCETRLLKWLSVTCVPQFQPGADKPYQVLSMFTDVTELKRDSSLFDRVQDLARIGGWEWESGNDHLYLTDEAIRILGQDAPPTTMQDMLAALRDVDRATLQRALRDAAESGAGFDLECMGSRADGRNFWIGVIGESRADLAGTAITGTLQDITERKQDEETLRVLARTDPLTGLLNRDAILGELEVRMIDPASSAVAVLYIDLDRFKAVNDVLGHAAGDELLIAAARRISRASGTEGLCARFGGDEFLVLCHTGDDHGLPERIAGRILDAFSDGFRFGNEEFPVTASIGIACAPEDGQRPQILIQNADAAMYDSKRRMRNSFQRFTPALVQSQQEKLKLETQLRRAADNNEFHLVYQPQVDLRHGRIVAAEALIRWRNQQLGEMRPDHFIGHAESTGDIIRIGSWVLREACEQAARWRDAGLGIVRIAVNVSYRQFLGEDLAGGVRDALREFGLPGSALELEFTERVLIEDAPDTLRTFADLRALGVVLTIDDFGEGYSALNYLRRLPIHGLKLSQLFVSGVPGNSSDIAVCQAITGIARSLALGVVAEGIETEGQRDFLLRLGVPVGQGFLFAPGLPPDEFGYRLLEEQRRAG